MKILHRGECIVREVRNNTKERRALTLFDGKTVLAQFDIEPGITMRLDTMCGTELRIAGNGVEDAYFYGGSIRWPDQDTMTQAEKLEALMERAEQHGFNLEKCAVDMGLEGFLKGSPYQRFLKPPLWWPKELLTANTYAVIFNHDFARALFGEYTAEDIGSIPVGLPEPALPIRMRGLRKFEFHLQQAVISDDPIGYMYGVVFDGE